MNARPVAVVAGASRGIGRAITVSLASEGFDIAAIARSLDCEGIEMLGPEIEKRDAAFFPVGLDISCTSCHREVVSNILERYGRIDLLVSNAGVEPLHRNDILELTEESYDRVMNINLRGPLFLAQKIAREMIWLKQMVQDYKPRIVFMSSVSAAMPSSNRSEFCISKAGLSMAGTIFADRLSEEGILVFEVRPGIVRSDMTTRVKDKHEHIIDKELIPQRRWGLPEDVGKAVASIARGDWDYSSGSVFEVSGGLNIRHLS